MRNLARRCTSYALLALLVIAAAEGIAQVGYRLSHGSWWSRDVLKNHATPAAAFEAVAKRRGLITDYVLHPYTGFARNGETAGARDQLGFFTIDKSDPRTYGKQDLVVVLTGGSVAIQAGLFGRLTQKLETRLTSNIPSSRRLRLIVLALGSFKQPQQLAALNYLLVLGVKVDAVVNLDGYNDISSPTTQNLRQNVHPIYPSGWSRFLTRRTGGAALETVGEIAFLRRQEWALIAAESRPFYDRSAFAGFILTARVQGIRQRLAALRGRVGTGKARNAESWGPPYSGDIRRRRADAVDYWFRASGLMKDISSANRILYLHILQPNQYVVDSKPMDAAEKACCFDARTAPNIAAGYAALRARAPALVAEGVDFVDATKLFASERRAVYRDACCHFNALGTDLLATFVADALAKRLRATPPKRRQTP